jgi:hypothetical protein
MLGTYGAIRQSFAFSIPTVSPLCSTSSIDTSFPYFPRVFIRSLNFVDPVAAEHDIVLVMRLFILLSNIEFLRGHIQV